MSVLAVNTAFEEPSPLVVISADVYSESATIGSLSAHPSSSAPELSSECSTLASLLSLQHSPDITSSSTSSSSLSNYRTVQKGSLVALDEEVLEQLCLDPASSAICGALLDFNDNKRYNGRWPSFINNFIRSVLIAAAPDASFSFSHFRPTLPHLPSLLLSLDSCGPCFVVETIRSLLVFTLLLNECIT